MSSPPIATPSPPALPGLGAASRAAAALTLPRVYGDLAQPELPAELVYPARTLLIIGGPPGAGKSHLSRRLLGDYPLFDPDSPLRDGITDGFQASIKITVRRLKAALRKGEGPVIANATMLSDLGPFMARIGERNGYQSHCLFCEAAIKQCLRDVEPKPGLDDDSITAYVATWLGAERCLESDPASWLSERQLRSICVVDRGGASALERISFG